MICLRRVEINRLPSNSWMIQEGMVCTFTLMHHHRWSANLLKHAKTEGALRTPDSLPWVWHDFFVILSVHKHFEFTHPSSWLMVVSKLRVHGSFWDTLRPAYFETSQCMLLDYWERAPCTAGGGWGGLIFRNQPTWGPSVQYREPHTLTFPIPRGLGRLRRALWQCSHHKWCENSAARDQDAPATIPGFGG